MSTTSKYALRSSSRHNIANKKVEQITGGARRPQSLDVIAEPKVVMKRLKSPAPQLQVLLSNIKDPNIILCESVADMQLRSGTRLKRKLKDKLDKKPNIRKCMCLEVTQLSQGLRKEEQAISDKNSNESPEIKQSNVIVKVLTKSSTILKVREYIKCRAQCTENVDGCSTLHAQNIKMCDYYTENSTKMLIAETRVLNFLKALDGMINRNVFPGIELIIELIGTILTYDNVDKSATNDCIITGSINTFTRLMYAFPPCITMIKANYRKLITESCYKSDIMSLPNFEFQNGIFWKLIEMLETLIEAADQEDENLNLSQQSEDGFDFYTWETRQITQHLRNNIPRDNKIDRIFYILQFLVDLMEHEFAIWCLRYQQGNRTEEKSFITSVIWQPNERPGTVTVNVKRIVLVFTKFVAVNFVADKIEILSSLLTLIGNVMLKETAQDNHNVYPNRNFNLLEPLAKEMFKIANDIQPSTEYSKTKLYNLLVCQIVLPPLKMLFGNCVIDGIENKYTDNLNIAKLHRILVSDSWKSPPPKTPIKRSSKLARSMSEGALNFGNVYPVYNKNGNKCGRSCKAINFEDYVVIVFETLKSYLNYFKLDAILREINDEFESSNGSSRYKSPIKHEAQLNSQEVDYKLLGKNLNKFMKTFNRNEKLTNSGPEPSSSNINLNNNSSNGQEAKQDHITLKMYDSDIRFFYEIANCVRARNDLYFKEFKEYINEMK